MLSAQTLRRTLLLAGVATSVSCGGERFDIWGVLHGDVTIRDDRTVDGVLVWEFFEADWERRQAADEHRCGRVLAISGVFDSSCSDCAFAATVTSETIEHDCPGREGVDPSLELVDRIWLQKADRVPAGAWPDDRWTWSVGWDGGAPAVEGVAWDEGMEFGEPPRQRDVVVGRRIRMMATNARGLVESKLSSQVQIAAPDR